MKFLFLITFIPSLAFSATFKEVALSLKGHDTVLALALKSQALNDEGGYKGSWGDPVLKLAAKNFPVDSLKKDQTPMTGLEVGISQKISLTTKYGNIEKSYQSQSRSYKYRALDQRAQLVKSLWNVVIRRRMLQGELQVFKDNYSWVTKILKVSKKLYANGRLSQQAILDLQIRKSEIESNVSNKEFSLSQLEDQLTYVISKGALILDYRSVPWEILNKKSSNIKDFKELSFKQMVSAKDYGLRAAKLHRIPDVKLSLSYTKRSDLDKIGDFVAATISFPLQFSSTIQSHHKQAIKEKSAQVRKYENYKRAKSRDSSILEKEISKIKFEIDILNKKTIAFARNSRAITSKSYGLGNSSYVELLQSELKLQKIQLKKIKLVSKRDIKQVALKYVLGESLYE